MQRVEISSSQVELLRMIKRDLKCMDPKRFPYFFQMLQKRIAEFDTVDQNRDIRDLVKYFRESLSGRSVAVAQPIKQWFKDHA